MKILFHLIIVGGGLFLFALGKARYFAAMPFGEGIIATSYGAERIYSLEKHSFKLGFNLYTHISPAQTPAAN